MSDEKIAGKMKIKIFTPLKVYRIVVRSVLLYCIEVTALKISEEKLEVKMRFLMDCCIIVSLKDHRRSK